MNMCKVYVTASQKGGVAKATTAGSLGIGLAKKGYKVLLVDADAQGSLTANLGYKEPDSMNDTLAVIMEKEIQDEKLELEKAKAKIQEERLEYAKNLIEQFCYDEYAHGAEFDNLSNISIAYTDYFDEDVRKEYDVQVFVDLNNYKISTYLDNDEIEVNQYDSLDELIASELEHLDFDSLVSVPDEAVERCKYISGWLGCYCICHCSGNS